MLGTRPGREGTLRKCEFFLLGGTEQGMWEERKPKAQRQPEPGVRELGTKTPVSVSAALTRQPPVGPAVGEHA